MASSTPGALLGHQPRVPAHLHSATSHHARRTLQERGCAHACRPTPSLVHPPCGSPQHGISMPIGCMHGRIAEWHWPHSSPPRRVPRPTPRRSCRLAPSSLLIPVAAAFAGVQGLVRCGSGPPSAPPASTLVPHEPSPAQVRAPARRPPPPSRCTAPPVHSRCCHTTPSDADNNL